MRFLRNEQWKDGVPWSRLLLARNNSVKAHSNVYDKTRRTRFTIMRLVFSGHGMIRSMRKSSLSRALRQKLRVINTRAHAPLSILRARFVSCARVQRPTTTLVTAPDVWSKTDELCRRVLEITTPSPGKTNNFEPKRRTFHRPTETDFSSLSGRAEIRSLRTASNYEPRQSTNSRRHNIFFLPRKKNWAKLKRICCVSPMSNEDNAIDRNYRHERIARRSLLIEQSIAGQWTKQPRG